jgi:hypothetical protein
MRSVVENMGTLRELLSSRADFKRNPKEDQYGFIGPPEIVLSDIPCMPATGRNTRQDGLSLMAMDGSLVYEQKWSAVDLDDTTRGNIFEEDRITIYRLDEDGERILPGVESVVAGVTEYDAPELGFAYAILFLKEPD